MPVRPDLDNGRPASGPPRAAGAQFATALEALHTVYGYAEFRGDQQRIIDTVTSGGDAVVLMPTGGGKSLCYQIPALIRPGTGLVVSPLIALMHDQVEALRANGVRAASMSSAQNADERRAVERAYTLGELDLLYLAPERVSIPATRQMLQAGRLSVIAIDEAHCVSQWGHDFRPDYLTLGDLGELFPGVPRVALTATATPETHREITDRLRFENATHFVASFDRPNIEYRIEAKLDQRAQLRRLIAEQPPGASGIVYALSRKSVDQLAVVLQRDGINALPYHAGLDSATRQRNQQRFLREEGVVMVATVAFGMGIDKPDVRFVAHVDLPKSVEGYYQETGRAGRDGEPAVAWMAYGLGDVVQQRRLIDQGDGDAPTKRRQARHLDAMLALCETVQCRRQNLLAYFGQPAEPCGNCDTCLTPPETFDGTIAAQKLLSTIVRLAREHRQAYGAGHLIDILRGADTERIRTLGHASLSTFGIGADLSGQDWRSVVRQLLAAGIIEPHGDFGTLAITDRAAPVLRGEQQVLLRTDTLGRAERPTRTTSQPSDLDPSAEPLFQALRQWRAAEARQQQVPAYIVFGDATLKQLATERPRSISELGGITGIGQKKLEAYGDAVLEVIAGQHQDVAG